MALKIIIAVTNDLETDQRVDRFAKTFSDLGHEIEFVGRILPNSKTLKFPYITKRFKLWFNKQVFFYANYNIRLLFYLLFKKYDVVIANDLDTLPAAFIASKLKRNVLLYDSHEYFTEVPELVNNKVQRNFWLFLELLFVPRVKYASTVSPSIAAVYKNKYNVDFKTIRNLPKKRAQVKSDIEKKVIIYQGALNVGRGIELMIETMLLLPDYELWIAGTGDIYEDLKQLIATHQLQDQVKMLGRINPTELHEITSKATVGLSLEEDCGMNYRFALPNKLFDYIQAQIPVIVSDLPEMRNIVETYQVGEVLHDRSKGSLKNLILKVTDNQLNKGTYAQALQKASEILCWEEEEKILLEHFNRAIE